MFNLTWIDFIVLILASYRLTHLIVFDDITSYFRNLFFTAVYEPDANGQIMRRIEFKGTGIRYWIGMLLSCYWCVGVWSSLAIILLYYLVPISYPLLLLLAIAGGAAIIETKV
jgi:hypothetical protein